MTELFDGSNFKTTPYIIFKSSTKKHVERHTLAFQEGRPKLLIQGGSGKGWRMRAIEHTLLQSLSTKGGHK